MRMFGGSQRMRTRDRRFTESKMDLKRRLFGYVQDAEGKAKLAKQRQDTALERAQMAEAALAKESTKSGWDRVKDITRKVFQKPRS